MTKAVRVQGQYEKSFRRILEHQRKKHSDKDLIHSHVLRRSFKDIMTRLFAKKHSDIKVISNNETLRELLTDKIWEEFYDIAKNRDIECAITIIFKRYDK
jgi:hypothetical protein